jgi:hypothetical protein
MEGGVVLQGNESLKCYGVVEHGRSPPPRSERKITVSGSSIKRVPQDPDGTSYNDLLLAMKHERTSSDVEDLKHGMVPFRKYNLGGVAHTPRDMIIYVQ